MDGDLSQGILRAYQERQSQIVIALTGRTGSGCTTAAEILCRNIKDISIAHPETESPLSEPEKKKIDIVRDYAEKNWKPFEAISASTVIVSFITTEPQWELIDSFLTKSKIKRETIEKIRNIYDRTRSHIHAENFIEAISGNDAIWKMMSAASHFKESIEPASAEIRAALEENYQRVFQEIGNNLRLSGTIHSDRINPNKIFCLIERIAVIAQALSKRNLSNGQTSNRIVIDAIRNPLELAFLRNHFAQFYAIAITADEGERQARLSNIGLGPKDIEKLDNQEYPKHKKHLDNYQSFISQNIQECIQKSDIFISNHGQKETYNQSTINLSTQLIRYVCLTLKPGLITPTRNERCMQLAFVAKLNSGCISRQVGAAVTDSAYSLKAIGWNDVPAGQVPCLLRDADELMRNVDNRGFSDYEKNNREFRQSVSIKYANRAGLKAEQGLRCPFCFKQIYNELLKDKNQVHTRSLHAEENAFLQLAKHGSPAISGGVLFTTASPCELCSKKAFQLGIKEIVYVDPYPGISSSHILSSGDEKMRPKLILFSGAIGHAYHRLYEPIMNIKDELLARLNAGSELIQPKLV